MQFYENFLKLCNSTNQYPTLVAEKIGLSRSTVTRWKEGSEPNRATVLMVADYFGVDATALTGDESETYSVFFDNFVRLCNKEGKRPAQIAKELGYRASIVTQWEKGSMPNSSTLKKVADRFDVSTISLLEYDMKPEGSVGKIDGVKNSIEDTLEILRKNPEYRMMFNALDGVSPEQIRQLVALVEGFKKNNAG